MESNIFVSRIMNIRCKSRWLRSHQREHKLDAVNYDSAYKTARRELWSNKVIAIQYAAYSLPLQSKWVEQSDLVSHGTFFLRWAARFPNKFIMSGTVNGRFIQLGCFNIILAIRLLDCHHDPRVHSADDNKFTYCYWCCYQHKAEKNSNIVALNFSCRPVQMMVKKIDLKLTLNVTQKCAKNSSASSNRAEADVRQSEIQYFMGL